MLELGKRKPPPPKTLLDRIKDIEREEQERSNWFEEKLKALREETKKVISEETHTSMLTRNQPKSTIIGAKEYRPEEENKRLAIYHHYAKKYKIPYVVEGRKQNLKDVVKAIHAYEMKNRDKIIKEKRLDPVTKTLGLYIF